MKRGCILLNVGIIEPYREFSRNRIDAHYRNALVLHNELGYDLLESEQHFKYNNKKYDVLILGNGGTLYSPFKLIKEFVEKNKQANKIVISNEYNTVPTIGGFSAKNAKLIKGYEAKKEGFKSQKTFNINLLLFENRFKDVEKKYDVVYYGTYRPNRLKYFKEYIKKDIYLSTSSKNIKKIVRNEKPKIINKMKWGVNRTLDLFRYSLYIEDEFSNLNFTNLANRYYEAQDSNCITLFDFNCKNTLNRSEIDDVNDIFIVKNYNDMIDKTQIINKDWQFYRDIQKNWLKKSIENRENLLKELKEFIEN